MMIAKASIERISANTSILTKRICSDRSRSGDADDERADHEGQQFVTDQIDPHDARGDVVIADGKPGAADARAQQVERGENRGDGQAERQIVQRLTVLQTEAEQPGAGDKNAVGSVCQPFRVENDVIDDEGERQRGDCKIKAFEPQGWNADDDAEQRCR